MTEVMFASLQMLNFEFLRCQHLTLKLTNILISWETATLFEPPTFMKLSVEEIKLIYKGSKETDFPCHTQSVERAVKLVGDRDFISCNNSRATRWCY